MTYLADLRLVLGAQNPGRYLKSAFWLTASRILAMGVSLLATFYVARTLGPQNFGEISYAQSVVGILSLFGALSAALYRDIVRYKDQETILLGTAWLISFGAAFVTTILSLGYVFFVPHDQLTTWVIGILCAAQFFSPFSIITNVFYAKTETKWLGVANLGIHLTTSLLKIAAMVSGQGVLVLALVMVAEQAMMAGSYLYLYAFIHKGRLWSWSFDLTYAKQLMVDSLPIMILSASAIISTRIDQILIKHFLDTTTVGFYSVAVQLSEVWQFIPGLLMTAVFPAIVNSKIAPATYRRRLVAFGSLLLIYSLLISAALFLLAPFIINLIYGAAFSSSVVLLQIYCWSIAGMVLGFLVSNFLLNENLRRIQITVGILPMVLNVILNLILIPKIGAIGAAWATVISYSLAPFLPFCFSSVRQILLSNRTV